MIQFNSELAFEKEKYAEYAEEVKKIHKQLQDKTCVGAEFAGWMDWPVNYDKEEYDRVKKAAARIRKDADIFLVCGIGGSYLGARSAIEFIKGLYPNDKPEIIFAGNTLSTNYLNQILDRIQGKSVYLNIISKSGSTTETAVSSRLFEQYIVNTFGPEEARKRIFCTTDKNKGILKTLADTKGYETFVVPDEVGGRYSVLTSVGLLPIAVSGIDVDEMMEGARQAMMDLNNEDLMTNPAYQYAVGRRILHKEGYTSEMFVTYDLQAVQFGEWWKQLCGESEGKDGIGLLPTACVFTTDLHSMGQFIQQGSKVLFETVLHIKESQRDIIFPEDRDNLDKMDYLAGKSVNWASQMAYKGTLDAHHNTGNVPIMIVEMEQITPYNYGYLVQYFFTAVAMSCLLLGVNPFDQPGVEIYKKNMFKLLGKE